MNLYNYFRIARRNLWKHKFYTALNVIGLSLGIAGGLVLYRFITYHLSYDRYHRKAGQLYRVVTDLHLGDGSVEYDQGTPLGLTDELQKESPRVKGQAVLLRLHSLAVGVPGAGGWKYFTERENSAFADRNWFDLFDYTWNAGNPGTALAEPNTAVITERLAKKYFGNEEPLGRTIRVEDKYTLTVTGVLQDYPANTDMRTELFVSRPSFRIIYPDAEQRLSYWGNINSTTNSFIWLPQGITGGNNEEALAGPLAALEKRHFLSVYHFHLQPLSDLHFDGRYSGTMQKSLLITLGLVALFLVLIACFNFINLATAQSAGRAKEIGTRRLLGGSTAAIFWQSMTESACIALLAVALSLLWIRLSLALLNDWFQVRLAFDFVQDRSLLLSTLILLSGVILGSGIYPSLLVSRFKPLDALRRQSAGMRAGLYRKGLIVIQNVVVQVLIICTLLISMQVRHLKTADLGFNKDGVLMVAIPDADGNKLSYLANELNREPGIRSLSFCANAPSSDYGSGGSIAYDHRPWEKFVARWALGDSSYLRTFGLQLLAGGNLQQSDTAREFLVNETLVHKLGIRDPQQVIGRAFLAGDLGDHEGTIVGVVKDFNLHSLYTPMESVLITTRRDRYTKMAIRLDAGVAAGPDGAAVARQAIRKAWESIYPGHVFEYHYLDQQIDEFYHKEDLLSKLISASVAIAIMISCLGLIGLITFFANRRAKEIGIRKVLGAGAPSIVLLLSKDFLRLVLLSMAISSPLAWWFMDRWLQAFAYRIGIGWWIFLLAGLLSALIALLTVGYQAVRAALVNPVESLRGE